MNSTVKVALVGTTYDAALETPEGLVSRYAHPRELTKALSMRIGDTTWVQGFREEGTHQIGTTRLSLFKAHPYVRGPQGTMTEHIVRSSLTNAIDNLKPDIVHIMGLLPLDILQIAEACSPYTNRLSASFHGGHPNKDPELRSQQKHGLEKLSAVLFSSSERAEMWRDAGLIDPSTRVVICPETSSFFAMKARDDVRRHTGMGGDPVCVSSVVSQFEICFL